MNAKVCALCLLWLCLLGQNAAAQYASRLWTTDDGLPQNIVRDVYQTPDGYLWIATLDGLARFDGVRFTVFNTDDTPALISNRLGLVGAPNGDLWLPTESGDLMRYSRGRFETFGPDQGIRRKAVRGVVAGDDGRVWILYDNAVYEWRQRNQRFVDITPKDVEVQFQTFRWDRAGFWGQKNDTLYSFRNGEFSTYKLPPGVRLWRVAADPSGNIWFETNDRRQYRLSAGKPAVLTAGVRRSSDSVFVDGHGDSWKIRIDSELDRAVELSVDGETKVLTFSGFYVDRQGNRWIRTEGHGLYQVRNRMIHVYGEKQGLTGNNVFPIFQDHTGAIWLGVWGSGLSRFQNGRFTNFTTADGLTSELITALYEDRKSRLWIGSHGGLSVYENGRFRRVLEPALPEHEPVQAILEDRNGTLWFGMRSGLYSCTERACEHYSDQNGLATDDTHVIVESRSGDLWIGGYGGLTRISSGHFSQVWRANGHPSVDIRALYEDRDGVLWIGTYDAGMARYENGRVTRITSKDGLFNNGVFQILEDDRGDFWISCNRGIYSVRKVELNEFSKGMRRYISSASYGRSDGLENEECNGGLWPAGIRTREGELWFPTQAGVAVVRPGNFVKDQQPPPVLLETVMLDNLLVPPDSSIRVDPSKERIEIQYSSPSLVRPSQIHFRYKLEGLDHDWIDVGSRRTAYYSHLPPGKFVFHVAAANSNDIWSEESAPLLVEVLAPFYRTWWFETMLLLAVIALIAFAWSYRVRQLENARAVQQAFSQELIASQENERKRIAAELHDSIGQRLVVIKNLALFVLHPELSTSAPDDKHTLKEITEETTLAIEETRQISYNLRPFQLDQLGLKKAIEIMARSVASASGLRFVSEIDDIDNTLPEDLRINFYRVVQEALGNIMKHAQATEVQIVIRKKENELALTVSDNGRGFTPNDLPQQPGKGGFGLTGMAERAHLLGGQFRIESTPGRGTVMMVHIPLKAERHG